MAKDEVEDFKYGVEDLAEKLGIQAASTRVQLRKHKIKKAGRAYGWNTMTEVAAIADQIQSGPKVEKKAAKKTAPKKAAKGKSKDKAIPAAA